MATTANGTATRTNPRATKKYKALIAADFSDAEALKIIGAKNVTPKDEAVDPKLQALLDGGFSREQAERLLVDEPKAKKGKKKGKKAKQAPVEQASSKDRGEAMVAERGLTFARGRVYSNGPIIEAQVRVLKSGRPEVVSTSGVGRTTAVLIYREESGDVAVQNLTKPV